MGKFEQAAVAQLDRAFGYEPRGQEFESLQPRHLECDPNDDIDTQNGQCICGQYDCAEEYVHWTSGF